MLATIWMWTHEWSLISRRLTALTLATCHQPLSCCVGVHAVDERAELLVRARRHLDPHALDRLRRSEERLALGLLRDRVVDALLGGRVELRSSARSLHRGRGELGRGLGLGRRRGRRVPRAP